VSGPEELAPGSWSFSAIGEEFDAHVRRHLPGYETLQELVASVCAWRLTGGARLLDVGCATGFTLAQILARCPHLVTATGLDPDEGMITRARARFAPLPERLRPTLVPLSVLDWQPPADGFDVVLALFTLQFVDPPVRFVVLDRLASWLRPGALVVVAEKCEGANAQSADLWAGLYADWKLLRGVEPEEILRKWARLRGQLIPWPAHVYERWATRAGLRGDVVWCWGPFRAWAWWRVVDGAPAG
jgi:tRNA (cmo5U34)-methyltransferase